MLVTLAIAAVLVQPGDTLSGIAASHSTSLSTLESVNPQISNPNAIYVGESVNLPGGAYGAQPVRSSPQWTNSSSTSQSSPQSSSSSSSSGSSSGLSSVPGVPSSFAACVAFRESTNGTNAAYNGGTYGIITASGVNVNGQSLSAQKAAFSSLYAQYGKAPWAADGCP